jgi:hypothetical protein
LTDLLFKKFKQISSLVCYIQIDCPHFKILKYKTNGERKFVYRLPSSQRNAKVLIEVVKGNSMGEVDNFTRVLNMFVGVEENI